MRAYMEEEIIEGGEGTIEEKERKRGGKKEDRRRQARQVKHRKSRMSPHT